MALLVDNQYRKNYTWGKLNMSVRCLKLPALRVCLLYALLPFLIMPGVALAEEGDIVITPYWGYRTGGGFEDFFTGAKVDVDESQSYGLIIGKDNGAKTHFEFIYGIQPTKLTVSEFADPRLATDIDIENYMLAGKRIMNPESGLFVLGMVGATRFDPDSADLRSETRFALGAGGGIEKPFGKRLGLRLEIRAIANILGSSGSIFCGGGGCAVGASGYALWQFEALAGLSFKF